MPRSPLIETVYLAPKVRRFKFSKADSRFVPEARREEKRGTSNVEGSGGAELSGCAIFFGIGFSMRFAGSSALGGAERVGIEDGFGLHDIRRWFGFCFGVVGIWSNQKLDNASDSWGKNKSQEGPWWVTCRVLLLALLTF